MTSQELTQLIAAALEDNDSPVEVLRFPSIVSNRHYLGVKADGRQFFIQVDEATE